MWSQEIFGDSGYREGVTKYHGKYVGHLDLSLDVPAPGEVWDGWGPCFARLLLSEK